MGIESDQVVYEYLSRVGDVAQQRQLPSATRMRLVSELRGEIDRRRAKAPVDSPAAVRRIIARLGTPDEVVAAAGGKAAPAPQPPVTSVPVQQRPDSRDGEAPEDRPKGLRRMVPRPRPAEPSAARDETPPPPHLASTADLGGSATQPDWWRVDSSPFGPGEDVPGFVGGVEIPEMLRRPPAQDETRLRKKEPEDEPAPIAVEKTEEPAPATSRRRLFRRPTLPTTRWSNPFLLLAAACLVVGAVLGNLIPLALGWVMAWGSRRLSEAETKWAVVILPGLSLTAGVVWLWGRTEGRWGTPITEGQAGAAITETWPWVVRGAAVASALFIVWRSQRQR